MSSQTETVFPKLAGGLGGSDEAASPSGRRKSRPYSKKGKRTSSASIDNRKKKHRKPKVRKKKSGRGVKQSFEEKATTGKSEIETPAVSTENAARGNVTLTVKEEPSKIILPPAAGANSAREAAAVVGAAVLNTAFSDTTCSIDESLVAAQKRQEQLQVRTTTSAQPGNSNSFFVVVSQQTACLLLSRCFFSFCAPSPRLPLLLQARLNSLHSRMKREHANSKGSRNYDSHAHFRCAEPDGHHSTYVLSTRTELNLTKMLSERVRCEHICARRMLHQVVLCFSDEFNATQGPSSQCNDHALLACLAG